MINTINRLFKMGVAEDNGRKEHDTVYDKQDIMKIFKCESNKAL